MDVMKKGQLSFDFLIAILLALLLLQTLVAFQGNFSTNLDKTAIRLQELQTARNIEKIAKYSQTLRQNDYYLLRLDIPRIMVSTPPGKGQPGLISCGVALRPEDSANPGTRLKEIQVRVSGFNYPALGTELVDENISFFIENSDRRLNSVCGTTILFTKDNDNFT